MKKQKKTISNLNKQVQKCYDSLHTNEIDQALEIAYDFLAILLNEEDKITNLEKFNIAGALIDTGSRSAKRDIVKIGIALLEDNINDFTTFLDPSKLEYNIGNGYMSLYNIDTYLANSRNVENRKFNPEFIQLLIQGKSHFWKAIKKSKVNQIPQYYTNLANSLDQSGRNREALIYYDKALEVDKNFAMAYINKGIAFEFLGRLSNTYTIKLLDSARRCYFLAVENIKEEREIEYLFSRISSISLELEDNGFDDDEIRKYDELHEKEYKEHSDYWKWCLKNYIVLSEHSLYCNCVGSRRDDLSIAKQAGSVGGNFIPIQENLLNHIKSEFCLARALYYQGITKNDKWNINDYEGSYTELFIGEKLGVNSEFLRTSFRLCFGILDKIVRGISNQFELASDKEHIYFDSFWNKKNENRWAKINKINNTGFNALYSLATDLNQRNGEWGFYKKYRNTLEHGLFVIKDDKTKKNKSLVSLKNVKIVKYSEFVDHALQMMQFTASAIFSFVFCIRIEASKYPEGFGKVVTFDTKKGIGKE